MIASHRPLGHRADRIITWTAAVLLLGGVFAVLYATAGNHESVGMGLAVGGLFTGSATLTMYRYWRNNDAETVSMLVAGPTVTAGMTILSSVKDETGVPFAVAILLMVFGLAFTYRADIRRIFSK